MTLATGFTLLRGLMVGPIIAAVLLDYPKTALALFAAAVATDVADGFLARSRHEVTTLGALLDPMVDKLLYGGLFFALAGAGKLPYLGPILYAIPQLGLGIGTLIFWRRRRRLMARLPGKAAAVLTALAALFLIASRWGKPAFWTAVGANFLAALVYLTDQIKAPARPGEGR